MIRNFFNMIYLGRMMLSKKLVIILLMTMTLNIVSILGGMSSTERKILFLDVDAQTLNTSSIDSISTNALISKLQNNISKLNEQYNQLKNLTNDIETTLTQLKQSVSTLSDSFDDNRIGENMNDINQLQEEEQASLYWIIKGIIERTNMLANYDNCIAYAVENNLRISEECNIPNW
jgi:septal ring factor EnvC (AmiA/AmiB activator)